MKITKEVGSTSISFEADSAEDLIKLVLLHESVSLKSIDNSKIEVEYGSGAAMAVADLLKEYEDEKGN